MTFNLFDIENLIETVKASSHNNNLLPGFLNRFDFEDVYETDDDSIVYCAGGENRIEIEVFDGYVPAVSVMYYEGKTPYIIEA